MTRLLHATLAAALFAIGSMLHAAETTAHTPALHLIGDSTMANKDPELPERGWGMVLPKFMKDPSVVHNHALNGRSTKSFIDEGHWAEALGELQPGDFLIIQFGHNDEKKDKPAVYADAATTYQENLHRFIREARARGATPILATPVCRRKFDAHGQLLDTHGAYPDAMRKVATEDHVPLLELQKLTAKWLQGLGPDASKAYFMWIPAGKYAKLPNGREDDTHFVEAGAEHVAQLAISEWRRLKLPLADWVKNPGDKRSDR